MVIAECKNCGEECRVYAKGICKNCYSKKMFAKASDEVKKKVNSGWREKIGREAYNQYQRKYYQEKVRSQVAPAATQKRKRKTNKIKINERFI